MTWRTFWNGRFRALMYVAAYVDISTETQSRFKIPYIDHVGFTIAFFRKSFFEVNDVLIAHALTCVEI